MRDLVVTENITLDGVIDASEGWFSVVDDPEVDQSDLQATLREQAEAADAVLFGRVTFEEMRGYWPQQTDDTTGVTDYLNRVNKYVVSGTVGDPQWEPTTVLPADGFLMSACSSIVPTGWAQFCAPVRMSILFNT